MFVTNRKFGVIGNLCVRQSGDEYSKKCCKWRLRYVDSHLLLRVEKLHSAWLDRECNTHFCIYFRESHSEGFTFLLLAEGVPNSSTFLASEELRSKSCSQLYELQACMLPSPWDVTCDNIALDAASQRCCTQGVRSTTVLCKNMQPSSETREPGTLLLTFWFRLHSS